MNQDQSWGKFPLCQFKGSSIITSLISCSAHRTPNFTNPEYLFAYFLSIFFHIKFVNWYQNTPKNANITHYIKKKKHLKLGKLKSEFVKLGVWWAERDTRDQKKATNLVFPKFFLEFFLIWAFKTNSLLVQSRVFFLVEKVINIFFSIVHSNSWNRYLLV